MHQVVFHNKYFTFKHFSIFLLSICGFLQASFANSQNFIPQICEDRAVEIGIFAYNKGPDYTRKWLDNPKLQVFDFAALESAYRQTLDILVESVQKYQHPLFQYLKNCAQNDRECHGWFKEENPLHIRIFCDRAIYRSALEVILDDRIEKFYHCVDQPFQEIEFTLANELDPNDYNQECFYEATNEEGTQAVLKNKTPTYYEEIEWLSPKFDNFVSHAQKAMNRSFIAGGIEFILNKSFEEFSDQELYQAKFNDLNTYYNSIDLINEFESCCRQSFYGTEYNLSAQYLNEGANQARKRLIDAGIIRDPNNLSPDETNKPEGLTFESNDYLNRIIFNEAEAQYWRDELSKASPLAFSEKKKLEYFTFLQNNIFFAEEKNLHFDAFKEDLTKQINTSGREKYNNPSLATDEQLDEYHQEIANYKKRLGYNNPGDIETGVYKLQEDGNYKYIKPKPNFDTYTVDTENLEEVEKNFVFNHAFQRTYLNGLEEDQKDIEDKIFEDSKKEVFPKMFKSFLPYQFERVVQAKAIREIQKRTKEYVDQNIISDFDTFHQWLDKMVCKGYEFSYCRKSQDNFRIKKHKQLYQKIISRQIPLDYSGTSKRTYVYDSLFVEELNKKINTVNDHCWSTLSDTKTIMDKYSPDEFIDPGHKLIKKLHVDLQRPYSHEVDYAEVLTKTAEDFFDKVTNEDFLKNKEYLMIFIRAGDYTSEARRAKTFENISKKIDKSYTSPQEKLKIALHDLFSTERFEELLGQPEFFELLDYKSSKAQEKCFGQGYIFGEQEFSKDFSDVFYDQGKLYKLFIEGKIKSNDREIYLTTTPMKKVYANTVFKLTLGDIEYVEDEIEERINNELFTLREAYNMKKFSEHEEFLKESVTKRVFALIDYALDNPNKEIGKHICNLIAEKDLSEFERKQMREFVVNSFLMAGGVVSLFLIPGGAAGMMMIYSSVSATALTVVSLGSTLFEIQHLKNRKKDAGSAVIMGNMRALDAHNLYEYYDDQIYGRNIELAFEIGLTIVLGAKPFIRSAKYLNKIRDKHWKFINEKRTMEINKFRRSTAHNGEMNLDQKIIDYVTDKTKVSDEIFFGVKGVKNAKGEWVTEPIEGFIGALRAGTGNDFIRKHWGKELGRYVPIEKMKPLFPASVFSKWGKAIDESLSNTKYIKVPYKWLRDRSILFNSKYYTRKIKNLIKTHITDSLGLYNINVAKWKKGAFNYTRYKKETKIIKVLKEAELAKTQTGKVWFSEEEIKQMVSRMRYYSFKNGKFVSHPNQRIEKTFKKFTQKAVKPNTIKPDTLYNYLEPLIKGELLDPHEWQFILKNFTKKITSIEDCKDFRKALVFSKKESLSIKQKLKARVSRNREFEVEMDPAQSRIGRAREKLANSRLGRFIDAPAYAERTKQILTNIDEFYEIAKYTRKKKEVGLVDYFKRKFPDKEDFNQFITDFDEVVKNNRIAGDENPLFIKKLIRNYDKNKDFVDGFSYKKSTPNSTLEERFIKDEQKLNNFFDKKMRVYTKDIKNAKNIADDYYRAYHKASTKTNLKKIIHNECKLPNSIERSLSNKMYVHYASMITLTSNALGYYANHYDAQKDGEFWTRWGFEALIPYVGSKFQAGEFVKKGRLAASKPFMDWIAGLGIMAVGSGFYETANRTFWTDEELFEREFTRIVYETEDLGGQIEDFFEKHPEVEEKILKQMDVLKEAFDEIDRKAGRGDLIESELEEMFIKKGLINMVYYEDMVARNQELGDEYIYHDLIEDGYLDEEIFAKNYDGSLQDQLEDVLAEMMYEDLYTYKSGKIKYFFTDEMAMPTIDSIEIHSKGTWADHIPYYGHESTDRFGFNAGFDLVRAPLGFAKNVAVYNLLCKQRYAPGISNSIGALGVHALYKLTLDPLKFYLREQATGR